MFASENVVVINYHFVASLFSKDTHYDEFITNYNQHNLNSHFISRSNFEKKKIMKFYFYYISLK